MTEQEAKTKWCPMRRITRIGDVRVDNTDGKEFTLNCIGSGCMMWRWHGWSTDRPTFSTDGSSTPPKLGHCGLAGKP